MGYNLSIAVCAGLSALAGLAAETGVVMLLYLNVAYKEWHDKGMMRGIKDLIESIHHRAVKRVRSKIMRACVIIAGLVPIMRSNGAGADVMKRIAAPMLDGVVTSVLMELDLIVAAFKVGRFYQTI